MIDPAPAPEGILDPEKPYWSADRVGEATWLRLKGNLTGRRVEGLSENFTSYVKLGDADADKLIENLKKWGKYPQLNQKDKSGGAYNAEAYQKWLVEEFLEKPFREETDKKIEEAAIQSRLDEIQKEKQKQKEQAVQVVVEQSDPEEVEEQVDIATEVLEEAQETNQQEINEEFFEDIPLSVRPNLVDIINKKTGRNVTLPDQEKKKEGHSNAKIYRYLTLNLTKIQSQLEVIDKKITEQNALLRSSLSVSVATYEKIELEDARLESKFDGILSAIEEQNALAKELADKQEDAVRRSALKNKRDAAGTEGYADTRGDGDGLLQTLLKYFGKKLGKFLFKRLYKLLPKGLRSRIRLGGMLLRNPARLLTKKPAQKLAAKAATPMVAKGFEHIALPGVTRRATAGTQGAAKKLSTSGGQSIFERALRSKPIQNALIKKLGKEGAEKLTVKVAAKLVPGISTAYGLGEGLARIAMGDVKGGFLSFGSAIPVAGWAFAAIDILRDIDIAAYTKHIEPNLPAPKDEHFAAFFSEALGVGPDQYEIGSKDVRPGTAMLHGTEWVGNKNEMNNLQNAIPSTIGASLLTSTASFVQSLGSAGSTVSPELNKELALLAEKFGVNPSMVSTNVGGSFSGVGSKVEDLVSRTETGDGGEYDGLSSAEKSVFKNSTGASFQQRMLALLRSPLDAIKEALNNRGGPGGPTPEIDPYTGPISGETFNPLPGGAAGTGSGQVFGASRDGGKRSHAGVDMVEHKQKDSRAPIVAYKTGKIIKSKASDAYPYGDMEIDHGGGLITRYLHVIPRPDLKVGDTVYGGQQIGRLYRYFDGSTEQTHLHFEVYKNGKLLNPTRFVKEARNNIASPLADTRAKEEHLKASGQTADDVPTAAGKPKGYGKIEMEQDGKILQIAEYFYVNGKYYERTTVNNKTTTKEISESVYKSVRNNHAASFGLESNKEYTLPSKGEVKQVSQIAPPSRSSSRTATEIAYAAPADTEASSTIILNAAPQMPVANGSSGGVQYVPIEQQLNITAMRLATA